MKHLYTFCTACLLLASVLWNQTGFAQTHTPKTVAINVNCGGYYEYLPQGFSWADSKRYPVIVYLHGYGDVGSGSNTDLQKLLLNALPKYINDGVFPVTVTSNGQQFSFIVISPQFIYWAQSGDVASVVSYIKTNYSAKIDTNRIYVTGFSMGGGVTWEYAGSGVAVAQKIAAIVPVCGKTDPTNLRANNMAVANLPVWATHNNGDADVPVSNTNTYISMINTQSDVVPNPLALKTIFPVTGHDAWTKTYDPAWRDVNSMNIYEWMLQYSRAAITLPIKLEDYKILSADIQGVTIGWKTTFEQNNASFSIERSTDGVSFSTIGTVKATNITTGSSYSFTDSKPVYGTAYYRLNQYDLNGKATGYAILKAIINDGKTASVTLWPNPASGSITLSLNNADKDRLFVKIINTQGMIVQATQYNKETAYWQQNINIANLPAGQYFVQVKGTAFENTQSLMINK